MLSSYRNILFLATLILSSFSTSILASPTYGTNSTVVCSPTTSILKPSPTATFGGVPSNVTSTYISSPTGISNGTAGPNSSVTGRPLSPTNPPVPASAAGSLREFGYSSAGLAVAIAFAVASL
ncbi:uncharacterized protein RCO7_08663 [Rhynchosporium graminicola]|uniref:Uncharacterized protein n=1 Tax=Rhynchosporium graminicola TaxID=2792576 RepID=A0A1E1LPH2_9HELO|nr:uncharacterized protein RCO7_08663 [Rhynchosporium commune]